MNTSHTRTTLVFFGIVLVAIGFSLGYWFSGRDSVDNQDADVTPTLSASRSVSASPSATPRPSPVLRTVRLTAQGPQPRSLTVMRGDSVSFVNDIVTPFWLVSDPHPAHTMCPGLDARRALGLGESYTLTFSATQTCSYHNEVYPDDSTYRGTIIVR